MRTTLRLLVAVMLVAGAAASARAQNVSVSGTVADETKSVLPGAWCSAWVKRA